MKYLILSILLVINNSFADTCDLTYKDSGIKDRPIIEIDCTKPIYNNDTGEHSDSLYTSDFNKANDYIK
jgi:hypothetical protein